MSSRPHLDKQQQQENVLILRFLIMSAKTPSTAPLPRQVRSYSQDMAMSLGVISRLL